MTSGRGPIVICGLGNMGYRLAELLNSLGEPVSVVALSGRPHWMRSLEAAGVLVVEGDARQAHLLSAAGTDRARSVVVAVDKDTAAVEIAAAVRELNPDVLLVIRASDLMWADFFERAFSDCRSLCVSHISAVSIAAAAMHEEVLFSEHFHDHAFTLHQCPGSEWEGHTVTEAQQHHNLRIYTINGEPPTPLQVIRAEDTLVYSVAVEEEVAQRRPRRAAQLRKWMDAFRIVSPWEVVKLIPAVWRNASTPIRACFVTLSLLMVVTSVVYNLRSQEENYLDALLYAVAVAAGVTLDPIATSPTLWKLFDLVVIISGAALATILFTMAAEYILSLRILEFGGRVPTKMRNHVIVAGLGKVGHRVAEILVSQGEAVVGIELHRDAPYLARVRAQQVPVLLGDAADPQLLERANIRQARAIVAGTDNDANNIRIALNAERLHPKVEAVIRVFDLSLAKTLEKTYSVHSAVSPADTAAPTFALVSLCRHARLGFMAGNHFFGVYEIEAREGDSFVGKTPLELANERRFVILWSREGGRFGPPPSTEKIEPGQTVIFGAEWRIVSELAGFATSRTERKKDGARGRDGDEVGAP